MPLPRIELARRIDALAALRGLKVTTTLPEELDKYGADKHLASGLRDGRLKPRRAALDQLAGFFNVPVAWFEVEDWRSLIGANDPRLTRRLGEIERDVALVRSVLAEVHSSEFEAALSALGEDDETTTGAPEEAARARKN